MHKRRIESSLRNYIEIIVYSPSTCSYQVASSLPSELPSFSVAKIQRSWKHSSDILVHIGMMTSAADLSAVHPQCESPVPPHPKGCSVGLRPGDCGDLWTTVSCSRNQFEVISALWHGRLVPIRYSDRIGRRYEQKMRIGIGSASAKKCRSRLPIQFFFGVRSEFSSVPRSALFT